MDTRHPVTEPLDTDSVDDQRMRIGLVGCVKSKRSSRALVAADLYTSTLFVGRRRWVERSCGRWYILSALHGLVDPAETVEPYDATLETASSHERREWSKRVLADLHDRLGDLGQYVFEVHAGSSYRDHGLIDGLTQSGATVEIPTAGLRQGEQLAFYGRADLPGREPSPVGRSEQHADTRTSSYRALTEFLRETTDSEVEVTFAKVERIISRPLPASASRHRAWWANDASHSHATSWLSAGFRVASVDQRAGRVRFCKAPT